jgi:hypothetical protein
MALKSLNMRLELPARSTALSSGPAAAYISAALVPVEVPF